MSRTMRNIHPFLAVLLLHFLGQTVWCAAAEPEARKTILDTRSYWRFRMVRETSELVDPSGRIVHGSVVTDFDNSTRIYSWFKSHPNKPSLPAEKWRVKPIPKNRVRTLPSDTSADWMKPEFNDSSWFRSPGPMLSNAASGDDGWKLILMRGTFWVSDPTEAGDLTLSMRFRGGVIVYLNGKEVARHHMPKGPVTLATPAERYPMSAHFTSDGFVLPWSRQATRGAKARMPKEIRDAVASRTRRMSDAIIPGAKLRRGENVLAVGLHRSPTPASRYVGRLKGRMAANSDYSWTRLGLNNIRLSAAPGAKIAPNTGPGNGHGLRLWNHSIVQKVSPSDYPDPFDSPKPIQISATRNGSFSGQIIVGDEKPIKGLKATASPLKGPGVIPASAIQIRYARADGAKGVFDSLEESAPKTVSVSEGTRRSVQPVWITVHVPERAKAGDYTGTVTVSVAGAAPLTSRISLHVSGWGLPAPKDFTARMDVVESPESVAMAYDVPLWSDRHFKLLDKTFSLLGNLGNKTLYVTCIRRTHFGNEHAMVRWTRDDEGELRPDFTIAEKYIDVAMKHMGKIPGVVLYCWEPPSSQGHAGGTGRAGRIHDKPILFSLYDPETKEYSAARGPAWGTREARAFWKKLTDGIQPVLAKRGLKDSMLFGLIGDHRPTKQAMDDISNGVRGAKWAVHSHLRCETWHRYQMGMFIALWGIGCRPTDPSAGYSFGWSNPKWMSYYPREMSLGSTLTEHRCKLELWLGARSKNARGAGRIATGSGPRGLGRLGADFWPVVKDGRGRTRWTLAGRYPESAWGQLNLNYGVPRILGKGRTGPVATARSEAFREAMQEVEARVYLEKALLDPTARQLLGDALIRRCRELLDDRIRVVNVSAGKGDAREAWFISSGWRDRAEQLFELAAEVKQKYGDRDPAPDLASRRKKK